MSQLKVIVLLSGGGTTLLNLIEKRDAGELDIDIDLVVSSRPDAKGLERAESAGIETAVVASKDFTVSGVCDWQGMSGELDRIILPRKPDLVCLCGFMCFYQLPEELEGRVMNIHPALIPSFCGKGMYGHHVHEAVVKSGVKLSGCTVHFVNNEYDAGPIILQKPCPVFDTDSADDVAKRVFELECSAYPEAISLYSEGRLEIDGEIVRVK